MIIDERTYHLSLSKEADRYGKDLDKTLKPVMILAIGKLYSTTLLTPRTPHLPRFIVVNSRVFSATGITSLFVLGASSMLILQSLRRRGFSLPTVF